MPQATGLAKIESEVGLTFPPGSKLVEFAERDVLVDPNWVAKVVIPASGYTALEQALLKKPSDHGTVSGALADAMTWWKPTTVIWKTAYLENGHARVDVVVSRQNDEIALYIEYATF